MTNESGARSAVWMVVRTGFAGTSDATFGPFKTYEDAEEFTRSPVGGDIYDAGKRGIDPSKRGLSDSAEPEAVGPTNPKPEGGES